MNNDDQREPKVPGKFGFVSFPVTASTLLAIVVLLAAGVYAFYKPSRDLLGALGRGFGVGAGILSAYYVSKGLEMTVTQRTQGIRDRKISKAFHYIDSWNHPTFSDTKQKRRAILRELKGKSSEEVEQFLEQNLDKRTIVVDVLNFFEGMALAANEGIADDRTLQRALRGALTAYFESFKPWIEKDRAAKSRPRIYLELENLVKRWNDV